jgi:hypothetical protein
MWKRKREPDYAANMAQKLAMTPDVWAVMQRAGVTEDMQLVLGFSYKAPDSSAAEALASFLRAETDYSITSCKRNAVHGVTQPTLASLDTLMEWVEWMCLAGTQHRCLFDDWQAIQKSG